MIRSFRSKDAAALFHDMPVRRFQRINDQWRICFTWRSGDAHDVEIVDYH